jgi:CheY-like chemotaxis protein
MEAIGTLAGGIAHDFNNILAAIMGYSSYLKTKAHPDDEFHEGLSVIEESSIRASKLSRQLLAISRRGIGEINPIDVNRIVMEVHALISKTFEKSILIDLETSKSLPHIRGDESQIHQVVMNLAINARNAMPDGGRLSLRTYLEKVGEKRKKTDYSIDPGTYVCIEITDDGCGMDTDTLQHIFEPYFTTRRDQGGSGLGMSVVYGIVKRHEGYIEISSLPGEGTRVIVHFPSFRALEAKSVELPATVTRGTETILMIDDERNIIQMLTAVLAENGYAVHSATSIRDGIDLFQRHSNVVDLVILDVMMPGMKDVEVLEELKRIDPDVNVLMTSGRSEVDQYGEFMEKGAAAFIAKPFNISELLCIMRKLLD